MRKEHQVTEPPKLCNKPHRGFTMSWKFLAIFLCAMLKWANTTSDFEEHSPDGYITYRKGDFPLIISAPHGGYLRPSSIPDRHNGCHVNGQCVYNHHCTPQTSRCRALKYRDSSTREIADAVSNHVYHVTGRRPHVVINELHRSKMDANRELGLATFGQTEAVDAFGNYTLFIHKARTLIGLQQDGRGLFVDIHGQSHAEDWTEFGYRIQKEDLNSGRFSLATSSVRALGERTCGTDAVCARDLISGDTSMGHFLQEEGKVAVPSPRFPSPGDGSYFRGGYNTETYGSKGCGDIDAIQIEIPRSVRFGDWQDYSVKLATTIVNFMEIHGYA